MLEFDSIRKRLGLQLPADIVDACRFLEACGLVFCVDFGWTNAHELAGRWILNADTDIPRPYRVR